MESLQNPYETTGIEIKKKNMQKEKLIMTNLLTVHDMSYLTTAEA